MAIIVNLDVMLARRKMSLKELSELVDISHNIGMITGPTSAEQVETSC